MNKTVKNRLGYYCLKLRKVSFGKVIIVSSRGNCLEAIVTKRKNKLSQLKYMCAKKNIRTEK